MSVENQAVMRGVAVAATYGRTVVPADPPKHRVLIWRDSGSPKPDAVLGRSGSAAPITANSLVDPTSVAFDGKRLFVGDAALHRVLVWNNLPVADDQPADAVLGQPDFRLPRRTRCRAPTLCIVLLRWLRMGPACMSLTLSTGGFWFLRPVIRAHQRCCGEFGQSAPHSASSGRIGHDPNAGQNDSSRVNVVLNGESVRHCRSARTRSKFGRLTIWEMRQPAAYITIAAAGGDVTVSNAVGVKLASAFPGSVCVRRKRASSPGCCCMPMQRIERRAGDAGNPSAAGEAITAWGTGLGAVDEDGNVLNPVSAWVNGLRAGGCFRETSGRRAWRRMKFE